MDDEDIIKGIWALGTHKAKMELEQKKLKQKERELEEFIKSGDQQTKLFNKQLELMENQNKIQEKQAQFNKIIALTSIILAISALTTLLYTVKDNVDLKTYWSLEFISIIFVIIGVSLVMIYLIKYMKDPKVTMLLHNLYKVLAEPLVTIENYFSIDASGISNFYGNTRWIKIRHTSAEGVRRHEFTKLNVFSGVKTGIIAAVDITEGNRHESPGFKPLLDETTRLFDVHEIYADAGYLSKENVKACAGHGITPYIWGKKNVHISMRSKPTPWYSMLREWKYQREIFAERYFLRERSESMFSSLKRRFGDFIRSKYKNAIMNEILAKIVCYNASVLASAMMEYDLNLGFIAEKPEFVAS